jgi:hypothetical protein
MNDSKTKHLTSTSCFLFLVSVLTLSLLAPTLVWQMRCARQSGISMQACQQRKVGSEGVGPRGVRDEATLAKQQKRYDRVCGTYLFLGGIIPCRSFSWLVLLVKPLAVLHKYRIRYGGGFFSGRGGSSANPREGSFLLPCKTGAGKFEACLLAWDGSKAGQKLGKFRDGCSGEKTAKISTCRCRRSKARSRESFLLAASCFLLVLSAFRLSPELLAFTFTVAFFPLNSFSATNCLLFSFDPYLKYLT